MRVLPLLACLLLASGLAFGQDTLYDPEPPAGSAFVRVLNASGAAQTISIGERAFGELPDRTTSPYRVVPGGQRALAGAGEAKSLVFEAGGFYTVVLPRKGAPTALRDPVLESRAKALVVFYNLADGPRDLKTADGTVALVEGVVAGGSGSRLVNGIRVDLAAFSGAVPGAKVASIQLERGNAYSFVLLPDGAPIWVKNATTTRD